MNNLKVEILSIEDLTEREVEEYGGDSWNHYLKVTYKDEVLFLTSDYMEVEDATFSRDLGWIPGLIEKAYQLGKSENE